MNAPRKRVVVECVLYNQSRYQQDCDARRESPELRPSWRKSCQPAAATTTLSNYLFLTQY
jgi:hypothetical protein